MSEYEDLKQFAIEADARGDYEAAAAAMDKLEAMQKKSFKAPFQKGFEAIGEPALMMGSAMVAEPVAGLVGTAAAPFVGGARAGQLVENVQSAMTYAPKTEPGIAAADALGGALSLPAEVIGAVENATGEFGERNAGPIGGAIGKTIPTAVGLGIGVAPYVLRKAAKTFTRTPSAVQGSPAPAPQSAPVPPVRPPRQVMVSTLKDLSRQKSELAAEAVSPDKSVMDAATRLNIDLNPSHYSTNPTYIELEQALKSRPGSKLFDAEMQAIRRIGEEAERLVTDLGGNPDRTIFNDALSSNISGTIKSLKAREDSIYTKVREAIPSRTVVEAPTARAYIERTLEDLGGNKKRLSPPEAALLDLLDDEKTLTYSALDRLRRDIGQGFSRQGPYADADSKILTDVYGALNDDQVSVARDFGHDSSLLAARRLTQSRKQLEEQSIELFGRDLAGSAAPKVRRAASDLSKGNTSTLTRLLQSVPSNLRKDAAIAVLNDVFTLGSRTGAEVGAGFATAFRGLNANRGAMDKLLVELPKEARQRFEDLGKVADALYRAKARENTSRTARDVIAALDSPGALSKLYEGGKKIAAAEGVSTTAGLPGVGAAGMLAGILSKTKTPASEAADAFIRSPQFRAAIDIAASGNVSKANAMASSGKAFKEWVTTMPPKSQQAIASVGLIGWLTGQEE